MSILQKTALAVGAIIFIIVVAVYPAQYATTINNPKYNPKAPVFGDRNQYIETLRTDIGLTSLRGVSVIIATAALWAIAGKKKTD